MARSMSGCRARRQARGIQENHFLSFFLLRESAVFGVVAVWPVLALIFFTVSNPHPEDISSVAAYRTAGPNRVKRVAEAGKLPISL